ncbi:hypothetical protein KIPB_008170, partial [Kipferlia bialata]|eukprot:g8170.t1
MSDTPTLEKVPEAAVDAAVVAPTPEEPVPAAAPAAGEGEVTKKKKKKKNKKKAKKGGGAAAQTNPPTRRVTSLFPKGFPENEIQLVDPTSANYVAPPYPSLEEDAEYLE